MDTFVRSHVTVESTGPPGPSGGVSEAGVGVLEKDGKKYMVAFGGWSGGSAAPSNELCVYDVAGRKWEPAAAFVGGGGAPPARCAHAMASTADCQKLVVFGGEGADGELLGDTWVLSDPTATGKWSWHRLPAAGPPPCRGGVLTAVSDRVLLLFGGMDGRKRLNTLHSLTLTESPDHESGFTAAWAALHPAGACPAPVDGHSFSYSPALHLVVLQSGFASCNTNRRYMLRLPAKSGGDPLGGGGGGGCCWVEVPELPNEPPPRHGLTGVFLPDLGSVFVAGFGGDGGSAFDDVHELHFAAGGEARASAQFEGSVLLSDSLLPPSSQWVSKPFASASADAGACIPKRTLHASCAVEAKVLVFGGKDDNQYLSSVTELSFASKPGDVPGGKKK
ncbi:putative adagio-like protein 2 [Diplonema papillatum]|nr:putative adagio-like protein 2 [Diplonema papillatum]